MNKNSAKGNAAEYFALYRLIRAGLPAWQTGGNNRRWDIIIQIGPDKFVPASVKFAKTWLPILSEQDEVITSGMMEKARERYRDSVFFRSNLSLLQVNP